MGTHGGYPALSEGLDSVTGHPLWAPDDLVLSVGGVVRVIEESGSDHCYS